MRNVLVTGGAGFIGSHLVDRLIGHDDVHITVLDSFEPFYDPREKEANVAAWADLPQVQIIRADLRDMDAVQEAVTHPPDAIVHLAARAGVRPSLEDPVGYQQVNVMGTQNLLELARLWGTPQFVFASSSSVYGTDPNVPWREDHAVLRPVSPYASTKVSGELLGHVYSHLYAIRFVALRFFTVYGPRQRPDLAIRKFAERMRDGTAIPVFGDGSTRRDYTFVSDTVDGILAAMNYDAEPYAVFNLGNDRTVTLTHMIEALERTLGVEAVIDRHGPQPGDVPQTWADLTHARNALGYHPQVPFEEGLERFVRWLDGR